MPLTLAQSTPLHCTMNKQFAVELTWRPAEHLEAGSRIEVRAHCLRALLSWRFIRSRLDGADIQWRWKAFPAVSELPGNPTFSILRATLPCGVHAGQSVGLSLTLVPPVWAGVNLGLSVWTGPRDPQAQPDARAWEGMQAESGPPCELEVQAATVERLGVYAHPTPGPGGRVRVVLAPEDRFGNPARFAAPVPVMWSWNGQEESIPLQGTHIFSVPAPAGDVARARVRVPMERLALTENIANGVRESRELVVTGNPVWREGPGGLRAAFGEFHWHTEISPDGQRTPRQALEAARDALNMNFTAPGDHVPAGPDWPRLMQELDAFNQDDVFATLPGWENINRFGHENYYFTSPEHPMRCEGEAGLCNTEPDRQALEAIHQSEPFIAIPHHTNSTAETRCPRTDVPFWHPYKWPAPQRHIRLVEIFQCRGNQERNVYDDPWRGWHQNNGASVQDALALGHRLGFTGGTDNHCGWPGRAWAESELPLGCNHGPKSVILTGVWTRRVERGEIFAALHHRATWAVWDTRALVDWSVNGAAAGSELHVPAGTPLTARLRLSAQDALQCVEVVSQGRVVWAASFNALDIDQTIDLGPATGPTHFYLRALERGGGLIYASPVFVELLEDSEAGQEKI